jgi:hypothetical protein
VRSSPETNTAATVLPAALMDWWSGAFQVEVKVVLAQPARQSSVAPASKAVYRCNIGATSV